MSNPSTPPTWPAFIQTVVSSISALCIDYNPEISLHHACLQQPSLRFARRDRQHCPTPVDDTNAIRALLSERSSQPNPATLSTRDQKEIYLPGYDKFRIPSAEDKAQAAASGRCVQSFEGGSSILHGRMHNVQNERKMCMPALGNMFCWRSRSVLPLLYFDPFSWPNISSANPEKLHGESFWFMKPTCRDHSANSCTKIGCRRHICDYWKLFRQMIFHQYIEKKTWITNYVFSSFPFSKTCNPSLALLSDRFPLSPYPCKLTYCCYERWVDKAKNGLVLVWKRRWMWGTSKGTGYG